MTDLFDNQDFEHNAIIKVIGVGGGGGNAVQYMVTEGIDGVEFIAANTDAQALRNSTMPVLVQLGEQITKGLGAGANPEVGRRSAEEDRERLRAVLEGADMVFITAGMGGGTGTGGAPIVAELAKEMGILTVAVVTRPFSFEGRQRQRVAEVGIAELSRHVDSLITIPNNKLLSVLGKNVSLLEAFKCANDVLFGAVQGISELITRPGLINVDFADVRTVMAEMGMAMMGTGRASGQDRARVAAEAAISSPLLDDVNLTGARGVLVNITAGLDMSIGEFEEVGEVIKSFTSANATVVVGTVIDPNLSDELRVTVVVTGLEYQGDIKNVSENIQQEQSYENAESDDEDGGDNSANLPGYHSYNYSDFERPALLRKRTTTNVGAASVLKRPVPAAPIPSNGSTSAASSTQVDYLDIPAFLRKQQQEETV